MLRSDDDVILAPQIMPETETTYFLETSFIMIMFY